MNFQIKKMLMLRISGGMGGACFSSQEIGRKMIFP